MENKYNVSLIIPTWNVMSKKIGKDLAIDLGLTTIYDQFVEGFSLEVIFVDDFSTDNTVDHISKWISNHPEVNAKIIPMQERGYGPGPGRNFGMSHAQGEFIAFMDNDDQLGGRGSLFEMYRYAKENDSDIVSGKYEGKGMSAVTSLYKEGNIKKINYFDINPLVTMTVWSKIFKREFLEKSNARFPEHGENDIYEDLFFVVQLLTHNPNHSVLTNQVYYYWVKTDGEHLSESSERALVDRIDSVLNIMNFIEDAEPIIQSLYLERILDLGSVNALFAEVKTRKNQMLRSNLIFKLQRKIRRICSEETFSTLPLMSQIFVRLIMDNEYVNAVEKHKAYKFLKEQPAVVELKNTLAGMDKLSIAMEKQRKYNDLKNELVSIYVDVEGGDISFSISNNQQEVSILVCDRELKKRKYVLLPNKVVSRGIFSSETTITPSIKIKEIVDLFGKSEITVDFYKVSEDDSGRVLEMVPVAPSFKGKDISVKDATVKAYKNWKGSLSLVIK